MQNNKALRRNAKLHYNFFPQKVYILVGEDVENDVLQFRNWDCIDS